MGIKKKILKTALKLFIEIGFWEVSINDLIEEMEISKKEFYNYFNDKDHLISEAINICFFSHFDHITKFTQKNNTSAKDSLLKIFQEYSELENYLKINFKIRKFNYESVIYLTVKGREDYSLMTKTVDNFNEKLLEKIASIIEEGKRDGEILSIVDSKSISMNILKSMQNSTLLWAMNKKISIKKLFETDFKYLWNTIKSI